MSRHELLAANPFDTSVVFIQKFHCTAKIVEPYREDHRHNQKEMEDKLSFFMLIARHILLGQLMLNEQDARALVNFI